MDRYLVPPIVTGKSPAQMGIIGNSKNKVEISPILKIHSQ
jgi:hypothetical protein